MVAARGAPIAWLTRHLRAWPAVGVTGLLAISFPWWLVSRLQTPDSLGLALGIAALFVLLELRRVNLGLALMLVTIGVRPNTVVMLATIAVCLALLKAPHPLRLSWPIAAAWVIAGAVVTEALILWSGDYGSGTLFYHSMVAFLPYPAEGPPPLSLEDIVRIYAYQLANIGRSPIPYFVLAAVLGIRLRMSVAGAVRADAAAMVLVALILASGGEYMIAPREPERILAMPFAAIAVIVAYSVFDLAGRRLAAAD